MSRQRLNYFQGAMLIALALYIAYTTFRDPMMVLLKNNIHHVTISGLSDRESDSIDVLKISGTFDINNHFTAPGSEWGSEHFYAFHNSDSQKGVFVATALTPAEMKNKYNSAIELTCGKKNFSPPQFYRLTGFADWQALSQYYLDERGLNKYLKKRRAAGSLDIEKDFANFIQQRDEKHFGSRSRCTFHYYLQLYNNDYKGSYGNPEEYLWGTLFTLLLLLIGIPFFVWPERKHEEPLEGPF